MKIEIKNILMIISGLLLLASPEMNLFSFHGVEKEVLLIFAGLIAGFPIFLRAIRSVRSQKLSIEIPVSIAILGALLTGEYIEAALVGFIFLFAGFLKIRSSEKLGGVKSVMDLQSTEATVIRDGKTQTVPVEEIKTGERVRVRSGGRIPVDGKIMAGHAFVNEAAISGEATPVRKGQNDRAFSSTILDSGYMEIEAEKVGEETAFARMHKLVREAQESKVRSQRFLEKFAAYYTPGILFLSALLFLFTADLHLSLTLLVLAFPGALVISVPVSLTAGIGKAAKTGVLFKGGEIMEKMSKINCLIFNKKRILTSGEPEVKGIKSYGISEDEVLKMAATAEQLFDHHLGQAIIRKAAEKGIQISGKPEDVEIVKGPGIIALLDHQAIFIGNRKLLLNHGIGIPQAIENHVISEEEKGSTAVFVANLKRILGIISIADPIREDAFGAIHQFRKNGIKHLVMLTGDNERTAKKVARRLRIDQVFYELLPKEKAQAVESSKEMNLRLCIVDEGIDDAMAPATAEIKISIGGTGNDNAMQTVDVILMSRNLNRISYAMSLANATVSNMKQNIIFSIVVVFLLPVGVLTGQIDLVGAMLIQELSVLLVILNALRLVRYPRFQVRVGYWFKNYVAGLYFPEVLKRQKEKELAEINGNQTFSKEEFQKCSIC